MTPKTLYLAPIIASLTETTYADLIQNQAKRFGISLDPYILQALVNQAPLLAGASGGKDTACMIILLEQFLTAIHYTGEKIICHADLGEIEHIESIDEVRRLANFVGWKLKIVRREKGGLLERYTQRWQDNCRRWANLECVNLISPWPQANSPFCRSETKVAPITQAAVCPWKIKLCASVIKLFPIVIKFYHWLFPMQVLRQ